ncbi:Kelch repeat-containing protein [Mucilaginibacter agri]|uniref:T9SS type A sorting domain-containing protein n=1 Tax=Mucilaginibacter agri TaxID=2695265 RepID=A0A966DWD3_9SPHI|nr:T9SS type A sorting domain-containing protein [Mucilaginibacter agri]NCD72416.1 T9SS type A sorting domain-containing protein [Mucilaginibacter agri]
MIPRYRDFKRAYPILALAFRITVILLIVSASVARAQWTRKADEIRKRAECNNVLYNNKLYVFSGFGDNPIIEKTNEVYDIAANKWSQIATFPAGREVTHQGIILVDDNVWIIGGRAVDAHGPASSKVSIYNITTNKWSIGPELTDPSTGQPFPLGAGGYALLGRTIHVFGGFGPTMCEDQAKLHLTINVDDYMANPSSTKWENKLAPMPIPRNHISYVVLGGKIYAFGGQFQHDCGAVDQMYCHVYDPQTDKWTRLTDLPKPRSHAEAATFAVDGKIFLVGGQGYNNLTQNTTYQFTPQSNNGLGAWTNLTSYTLPGSFLGLSSKISGSSFIITNGALNSYSNERKETYVANVTRSTARTLGFSAACISPALDSNKRATVHNLLYVIENTTTYSLKSDASWLTIKKNGIGTVNLNGTDIDVAIDANGLANGNYTGNITATGATAASKATFCINITVTSSKYTLNVSTNGSGTVSKTPDQLDYTPNSIVSLLATPATGWHFTGWSGDKVSGSNPLVVTLNNNTAITANFKNDSTTELISNIKASTQHSYQLAELNPGAKYYTDRDYIIKTVPSALSGADFIETACDDKAISTSNLLTFNISAAATIYVAYDPRATKLPAWLSSWKKLTDQIVTDDPKQPTLTLFSKNFAAGTITLGGNMQSPETGALTQYFVMGISANTASTTTTVTDSTTQLISNIKQTTASSYQLAKLSPGINYYTDRDYTIKTAPATLTGAAFIQTAADDKSATTSTLLTFNISEDATIYVAYDPRATTLPGWLSGWKKLTDKIGTDDPKQSSLTLFSKDFPAGTVSLGGNMQSPAVGALAEYFIIGLAKITTDATVETLAATDNRVAVDGDIGGSLSLNQNSDNNNEISKPVLYPNPVHNTLQVAFPDSYKYKGASALQIINFNGGTYNVSNKFFTSSGNTVDANISSLSLKRGFYMLRITSVEGKVDVIKFIVQ